jgi:restriction system protein
MDGSEFERVFGELFTLLGYSVERTQTFDKGADLILSDGGQRMAVQAKRSSSPVGITAVRQLLDGKARYGCDQGMVVTNHFFTEKAIECASFHEIQLWDRRKLSDFVDGDPPQIDTTVCARCGAPVSAGVAEWCLDHPSRYDGNVFCPKHQRRSQR